MRDYVALFDKGDNRWLYLALFTQETRTLVKNTHNFRIFFTSTHTHTHTLRHIHLHKNVHTYTHACMFSHPVKAVVILIVNPQVLNNTSKAGLLFYLIIISIFRLSALNNKQALTGQRFETPLKVPNYQLSEYVFGIAV